MLVSNFSRRCLLATLTFSLVTACESGSDNAKPQAPAAAETEASAASMPAASQRDLKRPVDAETLPYADVNENLVYGYFAFPSNMIEPLPAVILIHDWWGMNEDTRASADQLASEGYMVLAVDLYGGETFETADAARKQTILMLENAADVEENIRQALEFLRVAEAPAIGTAGWGFGGSWALNTALKFSEDIDATVIFYGQVATDEERLRPVNAPVLALFGARDRAIPVAMAEGFKEAMQHLRKPAEVHIYPDAGHAFADPKRSNFNQRDTDDAWSRMLAFFAKNLAAPTPQP
ncbi:MAG TPA: dienelactone hydrolase family protein [Woeseiaceae bacterium]|nr:dienelactone hydrolase family protein [Woeseiaceae bacterium]